MIIKSLLLIWCALTANEGTDVQYCLDLRQNIFDSQAQALQFYDGLNQSEKKSAQLWEGTRLDILTRYEVQASSK